MNGLKEPKKTAKAAMGAFAPGDTVFSLETNDKGRVIRLRPIRGRKPQMFCVVLFEDGRVRTVREEDLAGENGDGEPRI